MWSYALSSALLGVYCPRRFGGVIIAGLTTATGILWELLQLLSLVGGTFDIIDCIMYFIASVISNYIYHKLE
ncbi:MAG: hypothetical protein Q4B31_05185 [Clostridia bacterium]|nr:hypothetical protein [Clostridia bacterium]